MATTTNAASLTSRDFVIHIPSPSLACLLDDCGNCPSEPGHCTHSCHAIRNNTADNPETIR
jgi:hypothetical protein